MLDALRFVQGAVAKKDHVPVLTHFRIQNRTIMGCNGVLALSSPIDLDLNVNPKASTFAKAIRTCKDLISISMTQNDRLAIKSGSFKAFIDCDPSEFPSIEPEGVLVEVDPSFLDAIIKLKPFIAEDASRPWARGILFKGQSAFATNNVVLVQQWLPKPFPYIINVPEEAINELIRIKETPKAVQVSGGSITFHFDENKWLYSRTLSIEWPDKLESILAIEAEKVIEPPKGIFTAIDDLIPFIEDGVIFLKDGKIMTHEHEGEGASVEVKGLTSDSCFGAKHFLLMDGIATSWDLSLYPKPCPFFGEGLRGVIVGVYK